MQRNPGGGHHQCCLGIVLMKSQTNMLCIELATSWRTWLWPRITVSWWLALQNISKSQFFNVYPRVERAVHLLQPSFLKRTKLASYLCWSLLNYPFSHFQNTKSRGCTDLLEVFNGGSWGGPVVFSRGWKFFRIKFLPCWSAPSLVLVGLFWWSMMPARPRRLIYLWFWWPFDFPCP